MSLKVPDCSERIILNIVRDAFMGGGIYPLKIRLYTNNHTPADDDNCDGSDYNEATFSGYTAGGIELDDWKSVFTDSSGRTKMMHPCVSWTKSGATGNATIYGYYVMDQDTPEQLHWAELFSSVVDMSSDGAVLVVAPQFSGISEF